jgi:hypothetical protein
MSVCISSFVMPGCRDTEKEREKEKKGKEHDEGCLACLDEARRGGKEKENDECCFACCLDEARRGGKEKENDECCFACCLDEAAINQWQSQLGLLPISDIRSEIKRARLYRGTVDNYTITC